MKLLLDQNISPKLLKSLIVLYPGSVHVQSIGLASALDVEIWDYAKKNGFIIVTKDVDFSERSLIFGFPPKIIWIQRGNCSTGNIKDILINHVDDISSLAQNKSTGILSLF